MTKISHSDITFKQPVTCTDPITKGIFKIDWAFITNDFFIVGEDEPPETLQARGSITITGEDNPLHQMVLKTPLKLQGLLGSCDFGSEKRFIQITSVGKYEEFKEFHEMYLSSVSFEILTNLQYLERVQEYRNQYK